MAGGLFAVGKKYFEYLGSYDTGMEVWGGENLEFSFRIWQCDGVLETHPCSHVGHVFPKQAPYSLNKALANSVRAAEVWMDEFKELYYHRNPRAHLEPFGDVTERKQLPAKLQCKNFKWFLETVYPDLHVPEHRPGFFGMLCNLTDYCFDYNPPDENQIVGHQVILYLCHGMGQNKVGCGEVKATCWDKKQLTALQPQRPLGATCRKVLAGGVIGHPIVLAAGDGDSPLRWFSLKGVPQGDSEGPKCVLGQGGQQRCDTDGVHISPVREGAQLEDGLCPGIHSQTEQQDTHQVHQEACPHLK
ncbi:polypeptide N-acetylgalactosaminyltransferase 12-like [Hylobates moloch]|uniref:polypeptide N-acetylgalactosaminyltransferase 12-like n=1 Tax=Hylobates moloch TaxID=81572 RepID=UPI0026747AE9|nr:polypeptide N-acetylgalactosaminyltransferase 12-like [Hylobates moloch]